MNDEEMNTVHLKLNYGERAFCGVAEYHRQQQAAVGEVTCANCLTEARNIGALAAARLGDLQAAPLLAELKAWREDLVELLGDGFRAIEKAVDEVDRSINSRDR